MNRKYKMSRGRSRKVYKRGARKTKAINLLTGRGGTRL